MLLKTNYIIIFKFSISFAVLFQNACVYLYVMDRRSITGNNWSLKVLSAYHTPPFTRRDSCHIIKRKSATKTTKYGRMGRGGGHGGHVPPPQFYGRAKITAKFGQNIKISEKF
jgi:hypothetical protein